MPIPFLFVSAFEILKVTTIAFLAIINFPTRTRENGNMFGIAFLILTAFGSYSLIQNFTPLFENWVSTPLDTLLALVIAAGSISLAWLLEHQARRFKIWRNPRVVRFYWLTISVIFAVMFLQTLASLVAGNRYDLGKQELDNDHWDTAIEYFSQAIALAPDHAGAYFSRAIAYHDKSDLNLAIADYTVTLTMYPNNGTVYRNRGIAYQQRGDFELALADFARSITLNPNRADVYFYRSEIYSQLGKQDLALADLTTCLKIEPQNAECMVAKAQIQISK